MPFTSWKIVFCQLFTFAAIHTIFAMSAIADPYPPPYSHNLSAMGGGGSAGIALNLAWDGIESQLDELDDYHNGYGRVLDELYNYVESVQNYGGYYVAQISVTAVYVQGVGTWDVINPTKNQNLAGAATFAFKVETPIGKGGNVEIEFYEPGGLFGWDGDWHSVPGAMGIDGAAGSQWTPLPQSQFSTKVISRPKASGGGVLPANTQFRLKLGDDANRLKKMRMFKW